MSRFHIRPPSPAIVISTLALVVAASGTAIAAGKLVNGDRLIKKNTLSANRLRKHSVTGTQINLGKVGKSPAGSLSRSRGTRDDRRRRNSRH